MKVFRKIQSVFDEQIIERNNTLYHTFDKETEATQLVAMIEEITKLPPDFETNYCLVYDNGRID
jgi:hypothetical protein